MLFLNTPLRPYTLKFHSVIKWETLIRNFFGEKREKTGPKSTVALGAFGFLPDTKGLIIMIIKYVLNGHL